MSLAVLALVAVAAVTWVTIQRQQEALAEQARQQAIATVETSATVVEQILGTGDVPSVRRLVHTMAREQPPITSTLVANWNGRVIAHSDSRKEGKWAFDLLPPPSATLARTLAHPSGETAVEVTRPLRVGNREPGSLRAEVTFPPIHVETWPVVRRLARIAGGVLLITGVFTILLVRLTAPRTSRSAATVRRPTAKRAPGAQKLQTPAPAPPPRPVLEPFLEALPLALLIVDPRARRVRYANHHFRTLWGFTPARAGESMILPYDTVVATCCSSAHGTAPSATSAPQDEIALPDGRTIRRLSAPIGGDGGTDAARLYAFEDVTVQRRAESAREAARDAVVEAARAKAAFLVNMNEALRTPLQRIVRQIGRLLATSLTPSQRDGLTRVVAAAEGGVVLCDKIADYLHVDAGMLSDADVDLDLSQLVGDVVESLAPIANQKHIELTWWVDPEVPQALIGKGQRLRELLAKLVANALRFTDAGDVSVQAVRGAPLADRIAVRFEVIDTGVGIATDQQSRLFTPAADGSGGLGLLTCKQLVESMGGTIGARSERSHGSTFWFVVPLTPAPVRTQQVPHEEDALRQRRVMVVDDNATSRAVLTRQLTSWLVPHEAVASGREALTRLRAAVDYGAPYALAIVDARMPEMDGLALARAIREDPKLTALPLVLLTAGERVPSTLADQLGIRMTLDKPVRPSRLYTSLAATLLANA